MPVRKPSFRLSVKFVRKAAKAGARLESAPVAKARRNAKVVTDASTEIESTRGIDSGRRFRAVRIAIAAKARPSSPPATLSSKPSKIDSRRITPERAPRASRTAYSRRRRMARTSSKPATLTQAISKTTATARNSVRNNGRTSATSDSSSGTTSPRIGIADWAAGRLRMICLATRSASWAACERATPSLMRATIWYPQKPACSSESSSGVRLMGTQSSACLSCESSRGN